MKKTIIVADYNDEFRNDLVSALEEAGYQARPVDNGPDLVRHLHADPPDLLIWSTRIEMDTFKTIDPWRPRSVVAAIPRIGIGAPSVDCAESGWFARAVTPSGTPILMGRQPVAIPTVLEEVRRLLPLE